MKIIEFLSKELESAPVPYGVYHFIMLALTICVTILLCIFFKNTSDKRFRRIVLICWIIFLVLELYKQFTYSTSWKGIDGASETTYNVYYFPFQFCSSPFYVLPFIAFLPDGKIRNSFMSFASTYILFAGLAVMIYPNDVFSPQIGINIQTMVHHGMQVVLGFYLVVYNRNKYLGKIKDVIKYSLLGVAVFALFALIAIILNETLASKEVNFFFISSHVNCTLPVLSGIYTKVPYFVFLIIYLLGFTFLALFITSIECLLVRLLTKKNEN